MILIFSQPKPSLLYFSLDTGAENLQTSFFFCQEGTGTEGAAGETAELKEAEGACPLLLASCSCQCHPGSDSLPGNGSCFQLSRFFPPPSLYYLRGTGISQPVPSLQRSGY